MQISHTVLYTHGSYKIDDQISSQSISSESTNRLQTETCQSNILSKSNCTNSLHKSAITISNTLAATYQEVQLLLGKPSLNNYIYIFKNYLVFPILIFSSHLMYIYIYIYIVASEIPYLSSDFWITVSDLVIHDSRLFKGKNQ